MEIKIKKLHQDAVIPTYSKHGDAGMDLTAVTKEYDEHGNVVYGTGLAFEIPDGFVGLLFPRSSNTKKDLILGNSVGVLDSGYRGEVVFKFKPTGCFMDINDHGDDQYKHSSDFVAFPTPKTSLQQTLYTIENIYLEDYNIGDRIGQIIIMPYPKVNFIEVDELSDTDRGNGGFGSTGA